VCYAQEERVGARAAAAEGAKAFQEGRWADAIDYFTRAESLVHAPPHLLYIARAQKQTGLLVQARENLLSIIREDLPASAPHAFRQAQDDAKAELKDLEPRLPYVTLTVKGAGSNSVTLLQDGNKIPSALVGVPRPVDPGSHTFEATAGSLKGRVSVDVKEGEKKRVTLELGAGELPPAPPPTTAPTPPPAATTPASTGPTPAPTEPAPAAPQPEPDTGGGGKSTGLLIGSIAGFAVGVGGFAIGAISLGNAGSKQSESDDLFNNNNCATSSGTGMGVKCTDDIKAQISDLDSQADSARTLGTIGLIAGGVGVVAGGTLLVLYLGSGKSASSARSLPPIHVSVTPSFVRVGGTF
jgi:hypothetical protein